jgi:hypothetical protein
MGVIDDLFAKDPEVREVQFCMDRRLANKLYEAGVERDRTKREARRRHEDGAAAAEAQAQAEDAQAAYDALVEEVQGKLITFRFRPVEPHDYDQLKAKHRPTESQRTEARKQNEDPPEFNIETFPPAFVALACYEVETPSGKTDGLSVEDAEKIWKSPVWNNAERAQLHNTALAAYTTRTRLDLPPKAE